MGILKKKAQQLNKPKAPTDKDFIQEAIKVIPALKGATNVFGSQFLSQTFIRGYQINVTTEKDAQKSYMIFVWSQLNAAIIDFLVRAAKNDSINGLVGNTDHTYVVKEYKLKAITPTASNIRDISDEYIYLNDKIVKGIKLMCLEPVKDFVKNGLDIH